MTRPRFRSTFPAPPFSDREPVTALFERGEVLSGTYEIVGLLGEGGMGQVFEANDLPIQRRVAIKAARPGSEPGALRREARAIGAIHHPAIVAIHTVGVHRGVEYMAMERVYGVTLEAHLETRRAALGVDEALDLFIALADGLSAVHGCGLAHRDLKPANIVLALGNRVALIDFGLVTPHVEVSAGSATVVSGSPGYMAPEVISNSVAPMSAHLVDLYALGVLAFEVLAGHLPFSGESVGDMLQRHLHDEPPRLDTVRPDVPHSLVKLVSSLMAKLPDARPQSADEVLWQLRALRMRQDAGARSARASVLIADDDALTRDVIATFVASILPGADIRMAHNGVAAIDSLLASPPDVLLLDLHMPDMTGVEVCMYLRGTPHARRCKVISISGGADAHDVALLRQLGVVAFLVKGPTLREELAPLLRTMAAAQPT